MTGQTALADIQAMQPQAAAINRSAKGVARLSGAEDDKLARLTKLKKACADFESIMASTLIKAMRESIPKHDSGPLTSGLDTYTSMADQQLAIYMRINPRPPINWRDRLFWVALSRVWSRWREALCIVKPETVVRWHRAGWRLYWRWKSRPKKNGRPPAEREIRELVRRMAEENPTWGAPRIHGELLKLGLKVAQSTVSRYMPKRRKPASETWRQFP